MEKVSNLQFNGDDQKKKKKKQRLISATKEEKIKCLLNSKRGLIPTNGLRKLSDWMVF